SGTSTTANAAPPSKSNARRPAVIARYTAGWTRASRSRRAPASAKTMAPSALRSIDPSDAFTPGPNRARLAAVASVPVAITPCASASASRTGTPRPRNRSSTWLLPVAMPPVSATFNIGRGRTGRRGRRGGKPSRLSWPSRPQLGRTERVPQQESDGQGPDAAGHRRQRARHLADAGVDVAEDE